MSRDYEEFIAALNAHNVKYLIIGAHAVALHARPRATKDLDILIAPTNENAEATLVAVREFFKGAQLGYSVSDLLDTGSMIQIGVAPVRIDIASSILGISNFSDAWSRRTRGRFGSVYANYIGLDDLLSAKRATNRPQDRVDIQSIQRVLGIEKDHSVRRTPKRKKK
ncbi:MAG: nucleotidyltransferase [Planctomycetota bacterium]